MDLKANLANLVKNFENLETAARTLQNKNFADIAANVKGRIQQLCDHPDLEAVAEKLDGPEDANATGQPANLTPSQAPYSGSQPPAGVDGVR